MSKKIKALRDNLLVTTGCRAGEMHNSGRIILPDGSYGEDILAEVVARTVDEYIKFNSKDELDVGFDEFIETSLIYEFGKLVVH